MDNDQRLIDDLLAVRWMVTALFAPLVARSDGGEETGSYIEGCVISKYASKLSRGTSLNEIASELAKLDLFDLPVSTLPGVGVMQSPYPRRWRKFIQDVYRRDVVEADLNRVRESLRAGERSDFPKPNREKCKPEWEWE